MASGTARIIPLAMSDGERALRQELAAAYRIAAQFGWADMIFTHFSARVPGTDGHFLLNPYGSLFEEITASSLVKVDGDGNLLDQPDRAINPAGFAIHSAIHRAHPDAHCIFHLHTLDGLAVSAQKGGLLPISPVAMMSLADLAYYDFGGPGQVGDEGARTAAALGDRHVAILRNHGTLTLGRTCGEAFLRIYYLERACSIQVRAQGGGALELPDAAVSDDLGRMGAAGVPHTAPICWDAMLRKLDRQDGSYRA